MSFILDALKKLEEEKAARRGGGIKISEEILREERRNPVNRRRTKTVFTVSALVAVLAVAGVVAAMLLWKWDGGERVAGDGRQGRDALRPASRSHRLPKAIETAKAPNVPADPSALRDRPPISPHGAGTPGIPVTPNKPVKAVPEPSSPSSTSSSQVGAPPSGINLTVSGIAWQEARAARRAVINGDLVPEGASVDGATVQEIYQNRVRFESGGRLFDVFIAGPVLGDASAAPSPRPPVPADRELPRNVSPRRSIGSMRGERAGTDLGPMRNERLNQEITGE